MAMQHEQGFMRHLGAGPLLVAVIGILGGCRNGEENPGVNLPMGVLPGESGANGCVAPAGVFVAPVTPAVVPLVGYDSGSAGQVTAAGEGEVVYLTGSDGRMWAVDVSDPANPATLGELTGTSYARYLALSGTTLLVADLYQGLHLVDVSDATAPLYADALRAVSTTALRRNTCRFDALARRGVIQRSTRWLGS